MSRGVNRRATFHDDHDRSLFLSLLGEYAQRFNVRHKRVGHLWQGRFKAILVEDGDYFLESSRYIHLNPKVRPAELWP